MSTNVKLQNRKRIAYASYDEAKKAVQLLKIKSGNDYRYNYKKDPLLPSAPNEYYKHCGWKSWLDFLGTQKEYVDYVGFLELINDLEIESKAEYERVQRGFDQLPANPQKAYNNWVGWDLIFNTRKNYASYEEAKRIVNYMNIRSSNEYREKQSLDIRLPYDPSKFYRSKWTCWADFLPNKEFRKKKKFASYKEAQNIVYNLNITNSVDYHKRYREDNRLPAKPEQFYINKGWTNWSDYLSQSIESRYFDDIE